MAFSQSTDWQIEIHVYVILGPQDSSIEKRIVFTILLSCIPQRSGRWVREILHCIYTVVELKVLDYLEKLPKHWLTSRNIFIQD